MEESDSFQLTITESDKAEFKRLDHYLNHQLKDLSRSFIKGLFERGLISLHEDSPNPGQKIQLKAVPPVGTILSIEVPPPPPANAVAENIPLEILYEDEHLVFVNKPAGMVTHPAPGHQSGTLVNAILYHCQDLKGVGDQKRPGIVHRLDKGTSGVMVIAKTQKCHERLVYLFSSHDLERRYQALAMGTKMPVGGTLESTLGRHPSNRLKMAANVPRGKDAITHFKVLETFEKLSHLELKLETGRTHQIRVHLASLLKAPILCDPLYGNPGENLQRVGKDLANIIGDYPHPFLHAKVLGIKHPMTGENLRFEVDPPEIFQKVLSYLEGLL